ncbi:MAG TPA: hypothetical protein VJ577_06940 [Burkholderiaceae bacterium]|nr:hypothetical protein [Burkholderiaceae bacterium]
MTSPFFLGVHKNTLCVLVIVAGWRRPRLPAKQAHHFYCGSYCSNTVRTH